MGPGSELVGSVLRGAAREGVGEAGSELGLLMRETSSAYKLRRYDDGNEGRVLSIE